MDWINVNEKFPLLKIAAEADEEGCLVFQSDWVQGATDTEVLLGSFCFDGIRWWNSSDGHPETRVTHWMPLPEPPKAK